MSCQCMTPASQPGAAPTLTRWERGPAEESTTQFGCVQVQGCSGPFPQSCLCRSFNSSPWTHSAPHGVDRPVDTGQHKTDVGAPVGVVEDGDLVVHHLVCDQLSSRAALNDMKVCANRPREGGRLDGAHFCDEPGDVLFVPDHLSPGRRRSAAAEKPGAAQTHSKQTDIGAVPLHSAVQCVQLCCGAATRSQGAAQCVTHACMHARTHRM